MKNFLSIFFTIPAKIIFSIILIIFSILFSDTHIGYFNLYKEDSESFINAIIQIDSFDYESSHYLKNTVRNTVENTVKLSAEYADIFEDGADENELLNHYNSIGDNSFNKIYNQLSSIKGFRFAFVDHKKKTIYSSIASVNGKASSLDIEKYFGEAGRTLLIVRNSNNPYFATDAFIEYAELIRELSEKYNTNFDLYISFGSEEDFANKEKECEQLHFAMRDKIEKLNNTNILYIAILLIIILILLTVTGKQEPKGKTYPTIINRLPNDVICLLFIIVMICQSSLYRTATAMLISHGNELDEFWFIHSQDFYTSRIKFCIVIFICTATNLLCILKREYKLGRLLKNTYLYTNIEQLKKIKRHSPQENSDKLKK